eukprot:scaffold199426_cov15-Tisochrysis_lutea.AAC.2
MKEQPGNACITHPCKTTLVLVHFEPRTFGWMSIYYLDVVKSRMQAETAQQSPGKTWLGYARQASCCTFVPIYQWTGHLNGRQQFRCTKI